MKNKKNQNNKSFIENFIILIKEFFIKLLPKLDNFSKNSLSYIDTWKKKQSPTILKRSFGMSWGLGGWLLTPMIGRIGMERFQQMRERVAAEITTTFASNYVQEISFEEMLQPEIIKSYAKQATGEKYLVTPHK